MAIMLTPTIYVRHALLPVKPVPLKVEVLFVQVAFQLLPNLIFQMMLVLVNVLQTPAQLILSVLFATLQHSKF
jgi:hypothetical protein